MFASQTTIASSYTGASVATIVMTVAGMSLLSCAAVSRLQASVLVRWFVSFVITVLMAGLFAIEVSHG